VINDISSFGEDGSGELYIVDLGGEVFKIVPLPQTIPTLSEWGMIILALLLLAFGTAAVIRRRKPAMRSDSC
jgi:energy-converting hydrogenase Eha subunit H